MLKYFKNFEGSEWTHTTHLIMVSLLSVLLVEVEQKKKLEFCIFLINILNSYSKMTINCDRNSTTTSDYDHFQIRVQKRFPMRSKDLRGKDFKKVSSYIDISVREVV